MAQFTDFNFKLLVIDKLMYSDKTLTPRFDLAERLGVGDLFGYAVERNLEYTVLDEARTYFEALEISEELLATVDELMVDGGNDIYHECAPVWDGEDDLFDVRSLDDLGLLPNLKRVVGAEEGLLAVPDKLSVLAARGIAVE
ncbi:DUF6892 domain-containing protein [Streptomyces albipurpureus]|uniref:DUF6892 domain-containing protein n=1 Tax=Streptomyces albipurpureus TaxID=2897419 RepID=A0ABT0UGY3_9ACTN|nr:hypothetical protein [Streptomyces sp. CWNU-1]MCM2387294.1 hypothetical protein [Streptomyces sp. CWNU-1]